MTDEFKKRVAELCGNGTPLTEAQEARIDCALTLHSLAASVVFDHEPRPNAAETPPDEAERLRILCSSGAKAESYVAAMRWLNELLKCKYDRVSFSDAETVDAWKGLYEWLVRAGIRPPIQHWNGIRFVDLPFETVHARVMGAYRDVLAFRREIEQRERHS